jgi:hypothetical protein
MFCESALEKAYRTRNVNCQHQRFEPIMTKTVSMSASNQLRRKPSASAFRTNYDANWRYRCFEPIMTQTDRISVWNNYDANCEHERFEPIMTQTDCIRASPNYDANWQHRHFEPITTNFPHIKYVSRIWKRATDIYTSQSYHTDKWNIWKLNMGENKMRCVRLLCLRYDFR